LVFPFYFFSTPLIFFIDLAFNYGSS